MSERPKVGFGVMLLKDNKILLGLRNDDAQKADSDLHGEGTWTCPGGKLDFKEKLSDGAIREVKEETGIDIKTLMMISVTDEIVHDNHYVTAGFLCENFEGDAETLEPEEIVKWKWFDMGDLPKNIFAPSAKLVKNYLSKTIYNPDVE